ncbi:MAG: hypothetical protein KBD66_04340 [Candidatus Doudnabacteria bacterium]|nr:hypothetical protein [Candidatus Doudnabacteria bacterium]
MENVRNILGEAGRLVGPPRGVERLEFGESYSVSEIFLCELKFTNHLVRQGMELAEALEHYTTFLTQDELSCETYEEYQQVLLGVHAGLRAIRVSPEDPLWLGSVWRVIKRFTPDKNLGIRQRIQRVSFGEGSEASLSSAVLKYNLNHAESADERLYRLQFGDCFIQIHLPISAMREGRSLGTLRSSFHNLARIIQANPEAVVAVVGCSWLMSTDLVSRLGFSITTTYKEDDLQNAKDNPFLRYEYWSQVLNVHGEIKPEAFTHLKQHGKLPYALACGKISASDFIRRYTKVARGYRE